VIQEKKRRKEKNPIDVAYTARQAQIVKVVDSWYVLLLNCVA